MMIPVKPIIADLRANLPELPGKMRERFVEQYALTPYDAEVLTQDKEIASYFETAAKYVKTPKTLANWIISELLRELDSSGLASCKVNAENLGGLIALIESGTINGKIAKEVFAEMLESGESAKAIVDAKGLAQVSDTGAIAKIVADAIAANPKQVQQYLDGNEKVLMYLVGQVMKLSKGKANPPMVIQLLKEQLGK